MNVKAKVTIDYFKPSGKWYSEGSFEMVLSSPGDGNHIDTLKVPKRIRRLRASGIRPGLNPSPHCEFVWVVRVMWQGECFASFLFLPEALQDAAKAARSTIPRR